MMWSKSETSIHCCPVRMVGPNNAWETINNTSGEAMIDRCRRIDAGTTARCNVWLTEVARSLLMLGDVAWIWIYGAAQTLNGTLLKRLLTVRNDWSKK